MEIVRLQAAFPVLSSPEFVVRSPLEPCCIVHTCKQSWAFCRVSSLHAVLFSVYTLWNWLVCGIIDDLEQQTPWTWLSITAAVTTGHAPANSKLGSMDFSLERSLPVQTLIKTSFRGGGGGVSNFYVEGACIFCIFCISWFPVHKQAFRIWAGTQT